MFRRQNASSPAKSQNPLPSPHSRQFPYTNGPTVRSQLIQIRIDDGGYPARLVSAARKAPQPPGIFTAGFPACSSGQSDCRSSCAGRTPSGIPASGSRPLALASFPYLPFGRKRNWKFALAFSTCIILLKISRWSLRSGPGWFTGKCGSTFGHCSSLNQKKCEGIG